MLKENIALTESLRLISIGCLSIDEQGFIWRSKIMSPAKKWFPIEPRRAENIGGKGYLRLTIQINGKLHSIMAHRLIWTYFNGIIPAGMQINHKDFNKQNNKLDNLEIVTSSGNMQHSYNSEHHIRIRPWSNCQIWRGKKRLTTEQINEARKMRQSGTFIKDIASHFNISITHAHRITS